MGERVPSLFIVIKMDTTPDVASEHGSEVGFIQSNVNEIICSPGIEVVVFGFRKPSKAARNIAEMLRIQQKTVIIWIRASVYEQTRELFEGTDVLFWIERTDNSPLQILDPSNISLLHDQQKVVSEARSKGIRAKHVDCKIRTSTPGTTTPLDVDENRERIPTEYPKPATTSLVTTVVDAVSTHLPLDMPGLVGQYINPYYRDRCPCKKESLDEEGKYIIEDYELPLSDVPLGDFVLDADAKRILEEVRRKGSDFNILRVSAPYKRHRRKDREMQMKDPTSCTFHTNGRVRNTIYIITRTIDKKPLLRLTICRQREGDTYYFTTTAP